MPSSYGPLTFPRNVSEIFNSVLAFLEKYIIYYLLQKLRHWICILLNISFSVNSGKLHFLWAILQTKDFASSRFYESNNLKNHKHPFEPATSWATDSALAHMATVIISSVYAVIFMILSQFQHVVKEERRKKSTQRWLRMCSRREVHRRYVWRRARQVLFPMMVSLLEMRHFFWRLGISII